MNLTIVVLGISTKKNPYTYEHVQILIPTRLYQNGWFPTSSFSTPNIIISASQHCLLAQPNPTRPTSRVEECCDRVCWIARVWLHVLRTPTASAARLDNQGAGKPGYSGIPNKYVTSFKYAYLRHLFPQGRAAYRISIAGDNEQRGGCPFPGNLRTKLVLEQTLTCLGTVFDFGFEMLPLFLG